MLCCTGPPTGDNYSTLANHTHGTARVLLGNHLGILRRGDQETDWIMIQYAMTISNETVSICRIGKGPSNRSPVAIHLSSDCQGLDGDRFQSKTVVVLRS
ncbi:hypothetical protein MLD38_037429 [Melastoma candidum]|uniref:Uncharacterized protein n=1 Tax=Melastoma candidum TaxID=119954 RepID=A0ACB9LMA2_9MYRT|nr:hypothetical protein MLD38_037429 [Melastoma candidum]